MIRAANVDNLDHSTLINAPLCVKLPDQVMKNNPVERVNHIMGDTFAGHQNKEGSVE